MKKDMPVTGYQIGNAKTVEVFAQGPTGPGGLRHEYVYGHHENNYTFAVAGKLNFQKGHPDQHGINGLTLESVMGVCLQRLNSFQGGPYPSVHNATAIKHITCALEALQARQRELQSLKQANES